MAQVEEPLSREDELDAPLRVTLRALILGAITIAASFAFIVFVGQGYGVGSYVHSQFPMAAFMPFVIWLFLNIAIHRISPIRALTRAELLTIFSMLWVVGTIPQLGWMTYWTSIMAAPSYFAAPENGWAETFFDYFPWHVFAVTTSRVIEPFWFGLPDGMELPWDGWKGAIGHWLGVSMAMVVFGYCLFVLFRRQWVEGEKLAFPIARMAMDLTRGFDDRGRMPLIFRSGRFWIGFALVFVPIIYNIATHFTPGLLALDLYWKFYFIEIAEGFSLTVRVLPLVLALTYLCPVDILGSLVVFHFVGSIKLWLLQRVGFSLGEEGQRLGPAEILHMESYGALVFVALWSVWLARKHLVQVGRMVRGGRVAGEQAGLYRLALLGLLLSAAYVVGWGMSLGMSLPLAASAFSLIALTYFATAKLVAATGFAYLLPNKAHVKGKSFILDLVGSIHLSPRGTIAYQVFTSNAFFGTFRIPAWPAMPHILRIFSLKRQPGWVTAVVLAAFPVGFLVAAAGTIQLAYSDGGSVFLGGKANWVFEEMVRLMNNPTEPNWAKWGIWVLGWLEAAAVALLRGHYYWFPFHPVGLAFQTTFGTRLYWFSLMLVWVAKLVLLRYGGVRAFQRGKPFFYGLGIGYVAGVILSVVVDVIWFPTQGHHMHGW